MFINKKIYIIPVLLLFLTQSSMAQSYSESSGGEFIKRIEYNFLGYDDYNLKNKTGIDKLFFGDFNAELEFFVEPSFGGAYGFRIVRDSLKTVSFIEVKHIDNFKEIVDSLDREYPLIGFSAEEMSSISTEDEEKAKQHNIVMYERRKEESSLRYRVGTINYPVTSNLAEKLYSMAVTAIQNFKGKGTPPVYFDGFYVTFRCVVEDELWTLTAHRPGGEIKQLFNMCKQLIEDIKSTNNVDELKYITLLEDMLSGKVSDIDNLLGSIDVDKESFLIGTLDDYMGHQQTFTVGQDSSLVMNMLKDSIWVKELYESNISLMKDADTKYRFIDGYSQNEKNLVLRKCYEITCLLW
jgi:hypothetical protein